MQNIGFTEYARHKDEHKKLVRDAKDFAFNVRTQLDAGECSAVAKWFRRWLFNHFQKHDFGIERFLHRES